MMYIKCHSILIYYMWFENLYVIWQLGMTYSTQGILIKSWNFFIK